MLIIHKFNIHCDILPNMHLYFCHTDEHEMRTRNGLTHGYHFLVERDSPKTEDVCHLLFCRAVIEA